MSSILSDYNATKASIVAHTTLYSDLGMNFELHPGTQQINPVKDIAAIRNAVKNLILTNHTERPFHPELGCSITSLLFEPVDFFTAMNIRTEIIRILTRFEPRIRDINVEVFDKADQNAYVININFMIAANNVQSEVSFNLTRLR